jgi:hypothetical protein
MLVFTGSAVLETIVVAQFLFVDLDFTSEFGSCAAKTYAHEENDDKNAGDTSGANHELNIRKS